MGLLRIVGCIIFKLSLFQYVPSWYMLAAGFRGCALRTNGLGLSREPDALSCGSGIALGFSGDFPGLASNDSRIAWDFPGLASNDSRIAWDFPGLASDNSRIAWDFPGLASDNSGIALDFSCLKLDFVGDLFFNDLFRVVWGFLGFGTTTAAGSSGMSLGRGWDAGISANSLAEGCRSCSQGDAGLP